MSVKPTIIHTEASIGFGGQEIRIATEAAAFRDKGYDVHIVCQPDAGIIPLLQEKRLQYSTLRMRGAGDIFAIVSLYRLFRSYPDCVVMTHSSVDGWVAGFAARLARRMIVRTRHVSIAVKNPFVYWLLADKIITTGESIRQMFLKRLRCCPSKVKAIPTGQDTARFSAENVSPVKIREELHLSEDTPVISLIATLRWCKGQDDFIKAAKEVLKSIPEAVFLIVGHDPEGKIDLTGDIQGFEKSIRLLGYRSDIPEILAATTILVSASFDAEGISQSLLQGMMMKKGIVATDAGSTAEIIQHEKTGLLVPKRDAHALAGALQELIQNSEKRNALGASAYQLAKEKYSLHAMADTIEGFIFST